jgi:hypothetical protein
MQQLLLRACRVSSRCAHQEQWRFHKQGWGRTEAPLPLAVTTSRLFITQGLWRFPAEEVCSFQAAIFQERFHRFFRGRDSMKGNKEIAVFSFLSSHKKL